MTAVNFSSAGLKIAALEIEVTNQQQAADRASRDAARQAKLAEMKAEEEALAKQADALMREAVVGGCMRVGAGVANFSAGSSELDAAAVSDGTGQPTAGECALRRAALSNKIAASGFEGGQFVSGQLTDAETKSLDQSAARHRRGAEQASHAVDDKRDAIRTREEQFSQKLAVLQETLRTEHETNKIIVRG